MKKAIVLAAVVLAALGAARGDVAPTTYLDGYVLVPATTADAGDTGLTVATAYVCIPLSLLSDEIQAGGLTAAKANATTGDIRTVMYAIMNRYWYELSSKALVSSTLTKVNELTSEGYSAYEWVTHTFKTKRVVVQSQVDAE